MGDTPREALPGPLTPPGASATVLPGISSGAAPAAGGAACSACEGTGLVAPSPFHGDLVSWPAHVRLAEGLLRGGYRRESSATAAGLTRPLDCPRCGGLRSVPAPALTTNFDSTGGA